MRELYMEVGMALTQWERYEFILSILYASFVADANSLAARRSSAAVRTFEGRAEMLKAASEAFFQRRPHEGIRSMFKDVLRNAKNFSPRRNDIAHGLVHFDYPTPEMAGADIGAAPVTWALYPSMASFKQRDLADRPSYCMSNLEEAHFSEYFVRSQAPASTLAAVIREYRKLPPLPP
jgi:hypothetical protein